MTWIFAYGSIIWRPDFPYAERRLRWVEDHTRRFWQGSPDHRGTPSSLGRVVTLVPEAGQRCWGMAYRLPPEREDEIMAYLDHRERGGYIRIEVPFRSQDHGTVTAVTYIANPENEHYLGPAETTAMVLQIAGAAGESGRNADYVINLADHLREMGLEDPHVFGLAEALRELARGQPTMETVEALRPHALEQASSCA